MDDQAMTAAVADPMAAVTDLVMVALVGIMDPLRAEAKDAVAAALGAGVDVRMITGDRGELDIATAEVAVSYVRDVIDHHRGPVIVDLAALVFCDAHGLAALVRMAGYAEQNGCPFRLASPSPHLIRITRITGLDRRLLTSQASVPDGKIPRILHAIWWRSAPAGSSN
jgi:anti-anti-sigma factor